MKLDLSSLSSVREFAANFLSNESRLDVLIHNAGYGGAFTNFKSVDGNELTMATNHYGPFLLTHLLIDVLKKSAPSRIVVVSSACYNIGGRKLKGPLKKWPLYLYCTSKCANIMFMKELARRLEGTEVTANCVHPGCTDTNIWRNCPLLLKPFINCAKSFCKTAARGARSSIAIASLPEFENCSGKYFNASVRERNVRTYVIEPEKCLKFWNESATIVKLEPYEMRI